MGMKTESAAATKHMDELVSDIYQLNLKMELARYGQSLNLKHSKTDLTI